MLFDPDFRKIGYQVLASSCSVDQLVRQAERMVVRTQRQPEKHIFVPTVFKPTVLRYRQAFRCPISPRNRDNVFGHVE